MKHESANMTAARVLVAGVGNVLFADDGFGCEVARRLQARGSAEAVRVADFGVRFVDLAYALLDGYDLAVVVDAARRGEQPGTLYAIEPDLEELGIAGGANATGAHGMNLLDALALVRSMGGRLPRIVILGCEPAELGVEAEGASGLTPAVRAAVDEATLMIEQIIQRTLRKD